MVEYIKIETPFERDIDGSKKLIEGKYRNETIEYLKDNVWEFTEKVDGCVCSKTRVVMADGSTKLIKHIHENDCVMGYDTDTLQPKPVNVLAIKHQSRAGKWVKITITRNGLDRGNSFATINCTFDHKIWTQNRGYVEAYKLTKDDVILTIRNDIGLTPIEEQVLIGKMLGDGTLDIKENKFINTAHISWGQKEKDYNDWTINAIKDIAKATKEQIAGYGTTMYRGATINSVSIFDKFNSWLISGHKEVPDDIVLTPISMAFWYMDDGCLTHAEGQEDRVRLATNSFNNHSCELLLRELGKYDINGSVKNYKGNTICLNAENAEKLFLLIAPYICKAKRYKLPERYRDGLCWLPQNICRPYKKILVEQKIISIEEDTKERERWDIQTETHNFFTQGGLVHNSNIGIVWDGHKVSYQGRTERAQIPAHLINKLTEMFGGAVNEELFEQKFGDMKVILFGEGYGVKIQNGGNYRPDVSFILFDVYLPDQNLWLKRDAVEDIAKTFGVDVVPIIFEGTIDDAVKFVKSKPKSTIGTADMEGVVGRPKVECRDRMGRRVIVKIKVKDFI